MALSIETLAMAKAYTDETVDGLGALKGAPCTVESIQDIPGGKRITLGWESNSGEKQTQSFDIMDGEDGANIVEWSQIQQDGTKIAEININGVPTEVYAPTGGGGTGDVADVEVNGVSVLDPNDKIAKITSYKEVNLAEYEAIPVAERESNGVAYFIKDLNNSNVQGYPPLIYSDEEREIGVWRDGKPLYQKSISIGAVTANTVKVIDITSLNVDYVADYIATAVLTNGWKVPLPQTHTSSMSYQAFCRLSSSTQLAVGIGSSVGISDGYVTLQYTKTTDTAGSGIWNGQGGYAHHYSTNEQVIGTWIDGKPRYEITLSGSGSYSAGSELVVPLPTNADKIVIIGGYVDIGTDWLPLNLTLGVGTVTTNGVYCYLNKSTGIHIYSSTWTFSEYNITVQYCKTTD